MIKYNGEYLEVQDSVEPSRVVEEPKELQTQFYSQGSIQQRIASIRDQINQIKTEKQAKVKHNRANKNIFSTMSIYEQIQRNPIEIQLHTPKELYDLSTRVDAIESKIGRAEIYNQTVHRKGNLIDRVKVLQDKIEKLYKMSTQSIIANITGYYSLTQNKEDQFKYLFLYQQFLKTQGLKDQYVTVKEYLEKLKYIHEQSALLGPSLMKLQQVHEDILVKATNAETIYQALYTQLQNDYKILNVQLQELQK